MDAVITDPEHATSDWLTGVLQKQGFLPQGQVVTVGTEPSPPPITSLIVRLKSSYSDNAPKSVPSRLFLKFSKLDFDSDISARLGKNEVEFYYTVAKAVPDPPVARGYDAVYSSETGKFHLVLDDLSETHFQTEWPLPPSQLYCEQAIDCLTQFHAAWWEHPRLGEDIGELLKDASFRDNLSDLEKRFSDFASFVGDRLSSERRQIYEKSLAAFSTLWDHGGRERFSKRQATTLIHGDAHLWNFLYPHDGDKGKVYIIDWQAWRIGIGATDLAYMIALHWYPERRHSLERDLVRRYHAGLLLSGIEHYDWEMCWHDYRVAVIDNLFIPVWQWSAKLWTGIWWPQLERAMLAFHDLESAELLEPR